MLMFSNCKDAISGGPLFSGDNSPSVTEHGVGEAAFANIGSADNGNNREVFSHKIF
jgi:hypothetical protein